MKYVTDITVKMKFEKGIGCYLWRKQEFKNQTEKKNEMMKKKAKEMQKSKKKN